MPTLITHVVMLSFALFTLYPLIWMAVSSLKPNSEIFGSLALLPKEPVWDTFSNGWKGAGRVTYTQFYLNTFTLVLPVVIFTVLSSSLVAYGSRLDRAKIPNFYLRHSA
jgi:oligogalacturonide transport system permease protein